MKLKLDENLGHTCVAILRDAGHDIETIVASPDGHIWIVQRDRVRVYQPE